MIRACAVVLCLLLVGTPCSARTVTFAISAQYHGGISLNLGHVGDTTLTFEPIRDGAVHVSGTGLVKHPRDAGKVYTFGLDETFRVEGNWVRVVESRNTSNELGRELLGRIEQLMPFLHVCTRMRAGPVPLQRWFYTRKGLLGVTAEQTKSGLEVRVENGPHPFVTFTVRTGPDGLAALERFRVFTDGGVTLEFVADRPLAFAELAGGHGD